MKRFWIGFLAFLVVFLFIVMQVRVSDKDEQIGDERAEVLTTQQERDRLLEENKVYRQNLSLAHDKIITLNELQDLTYAWGMCLKELDATPTADAKIRCETIRKDIEMKDEN